MAAGEIIVTLTIWNSSSSGQQSGADLGGNGMGKQGLTRWTWETWSLHMSVTYVMTWCPFNFGPSLVPLPLIAGRRDVLGYESRKSVPAPLWLQYLGQRTVHLSWEAR